MRLGKLLDILETTLPKLTISKKVLDQHSVKIDNIAALLEVIESLSVLPSLEKIATNAIGFMPIPDKTGSARVHTERFAPVETLINALRSQASQLLQVLTSIMVPSVENTVYFKIPQQSDLSGLSTVINTIDVAFQQILNSIDKETTIKFKGFDTGSDWLILLVGGKIWLVLKIIDYVMKLAAQGIDLRKQYLALENLGLDTAVKKQQLEIQKIQIEATTKKYAKSLLEVENNDTGTIENEILIRVMNGLKELKYVIEQGGTVEVPKITAIKYPEEVAAIENDTLQLKAQPTVLLESQGQNKKEDNTEQN